MSGYNQNKPWKSGNDRGYYRKNRNPPSSYAPGRQPWAEPANPPWSSQPRPHHYYHQSQGRSNYHRSNRNQYYSNNYNRFDCPPPPLMQPTTTQPPPMEDFSEFNDPVLEAAVTPEPAVDLPPASETNPTDHQKKSVEAPTEPSDQENNQPTVSKKSDKLPERLDRKAIMKLVNSTTKYEPAMQKLLREQRSQLTQNLRNKYNEQKLPNTNEETEIIPNFTVDFVEELQFLTKAFENVEEEEPKDDVKVEEVGEENVKVEVNPEDAELTLGAIELPSNLDELQLPSDDSFFNFSEINNQAGDESTIETTKISPIKPKAGKKSGKKKKKGKKKRITTERKNVSKTIKEEEPKPTLDEEPDAFIEKPIEKEQPKTVGKQLMEEQQPSLKHSLDSFRFTLRSEILQTKVSSTPKVIPRSPKTKTTPSRTKKKHLNNPENVDKILLELEAQANQPFEKPGQPITIDQSIEEPEPIQHPDPPAALMSNEPIETEVTELQSRKWRSPGEKKYMSSLEPQPSYPPPIDQPESTKEILLKLYKIDMAIQQLMDEKVKLYKQLNLNNNLQTQQPIYIEPEILPTKRKEVEYLDRPSKRIHLSTAERDELSPIVTSSPIRNSPVPIRSSPDLCIPVIKPCSVSLISIDVEKYAGSKTKVFCKNHTGSILYIKVFKNAIVAAGEDGNIYKYDALNGELLGTGRGHTDAVTKFVIINQSKHYNQPVIYSGSLDATFKSFDFETMNLCSVSARLECAIQSMDSEWGFIFIGTKSGFIHRYSLEQNSLDEDCRKISNQSILVIKTSREGGRRVLIIAPRNEPVSVRDAMTGLLLRYVSNTTIKPTIFSILLLDSIVYCGTVQKSINGYDFTNGETVAELVAGKGVVCLTNYNKFIYAGCYDGNVYVFDSKSKQKVVTLPGLGHMVLSLDVTETKIVIGCKNSNLIIMDVPDEIKNFKSR